MDQESILEQARDYAKSELERDHSGHDWWHVVRVARTARMLAEAEHADVYICELAALLHDVADVKLAGSKEAGLRKIGDWMRQAGVEEDHRAHVMEIASTMSFGGGHGQPMRTLEGQVVQDADRLDAIGAIGIARAFAYAGNKGQPIYDPALRPRASMTEAEYRNGPSTAINHFNEKLLRLKERLNTETARLLAEKRHRFLEYFLREFDREWAAGNADYLKETLFPAEYAGRIHIAFGDSAGGSLRIALRGMPGEKAVTLNDDLMVGPLHNEDEPEGLAKRLSWWRTCTSEEERRETMEYALRAALDWKQWPKRLRGRHVVAWAGESASEQIGLRRLAAALADDTEISVIDTTALANKRYKKTAFENEDAIYRSTGELGPDKLALLLPEARLLTPREREAYADEWRQLVADGGILRVMDKGRPLSVDGSYFDADIMEAVSNLTGAEGRLVKCARIVGEVIGSANQYVGDSYIEYRVRELIKEGKLVYTGSLNAMRYYSVGLGE
ncbi:phosphohydrolase [Paenibacillus sp. 32O-W]|uniref:DUF3658 domain-containing protein n=1 Tax=Paenibacillus sp. 32O-W TaxID=1695218 RepID=UPI000720EB09|nr:DUF3658 domain-containing protein [Paenibacillus sp. 32O-W]ALS26129.1 phosphohydrolase [Paenibacillus sp. 32O-W]